MTPQHTVKATRESSYKRRFSNGQICPQMWIQLISKDETEGKMTSEQAGAADSCLAEHHQRQNPMLMSKHIIKATIECYIIKLSNYFWSLWKEATYTMCCISIFTLFGYKYPEIQNFKNLKFLNLLLKYWKCWNVWHILKIKSLYV